jgi:hypothetical protein
MYRRKRNKLGDIAPIAQSFRDALMRVVWRVIGNRDGAIVMVRRFLRVFVLVLVRQAVANLNGGRCDGDR